MWLLIFQRLSLDFLLHLVFFPVWWYTRGMIFAGKRVWQFFLLGNVSLAPGLWLKNIFVPMFGQADWQGRLMSFFMRLMNVIVRGALLMIWLTVVAAIFLVWPIVPLVVVYFLRRSLM